MKKILILILILIFPLIVLAAALFSDGFESGDLSAWSSAATDGGKLSAETAAKLYGNYGLSVFIDDTDWKYVQDDTPVAEKRYRFRFYLDPNSLEMANGDSMDVFTLFDTANFFWILFKFSDPNYTIAAMDAANATWRSTGYYVISDAPHCIEVDWTAATGGQTDGTFTLWIDGALKETETAVDSDEEQVDYVRLGATAQDAGTSGTFYLDDFVSNDDGGEIGAAFTDNFMGFCF